MGRESRKTALPAVGKHAKARHSKMDRMAQADPMVYSTLNALKQAPTIKHKSYFEIAENADKKAKKLETQVTSDRTPPPGYEFIALGNPELTARCKDISREQDAMIFIVSESKDHSIHSQMHRLGYHFRERIVDQARRDLTETGVLKPQKIAVSGRPEAIPKDRHQILKEADAVLRDLFPRIPNISRMEILAHSFDKDNKYFNGKEKVGMAEDLPLARRVQLAALSHIRHTMTRYDELLRDGQKWENARKAVEKPCLDTIVKWRGDEETGRDQLDEILREVIEISDDEDSEGETTEEEVLAGPSRIFYQQGAPATASASELQPATRPSASFSGAQNAQSPKRAPSVIYLTSPAQPKKLTRKERKAVKQTQQRFKRYAQVAETFRHDSLPPISSGAQPTAEAMHTNESRAQPRVPEHLVEYRTSNTSSQPVLQSHADSPHGLARTRGQSPVFVRVADSNGSTMGPAVKYQAYEPTPVSPAKNHFQDMLVRSIEPQSPGVARYHERGTSYPFPGEHERFPEARQCISRPVNEQMAGRGRAVSPSHVLGSRSGPSIRRQVMMPPEDQRELFSEAGFIQVHREPDSRVLVRRYPADPPPGSHITGQPRQYDARSRSPVAYRQEPSYRESGHIVYGPAADAVYVNGPTSSGHGKVTLRSRDHPIILDSPRVTSRVIETRQPYDARDFMVRPQEPVEIVRREPGQGIRRVIDRPQAVYAKDPEPRIIRVREYQNEHRAPQPVPMGSHSGRASVIHSYGNDVEHSQRASHHHTSSANPQVMHYREVDRYTPLEESLLPKLTIAPQDERVTQFNQERPQYHIIREVDNGQFRQQGQPIHFQQSHPVSYH